MATQNDITIAKLQATAEIMKAYLSSGHVSHSGTLDSVAKEVYKALSESVSEHD